MKRILGVLLTAFSLLSLLSTPAQALDFGPTILISVHDQKLAMVKDGKVIEKFRISTSKFGLGDDFGSYKTPLGTLWVCNKIGDELPLGAVIKSRHATGEVLSANAPGRDPIVTRVIWLKGLFGDTQNAYSRCIYIHGTPEERTLGKPASFGCIRMRSKDVAKLYDAVEIGTHVVISEDTLSTLVAAQRTTGQVASSN